MGWESRGSRRYYYEVRRVGGRVVKTYVGAGPVATAISTLNDLDREKRKWAKIDRDVAAARRARGGRAARLLAVADRVLDGWLAAAGFHRPRRGPWRRRRAFTAEVPMEMVTRRPFDAWSVGDLVRAGAAAPAGLVRKGDTVDPAALQAHLAARPAAVGLYGDLARFAVEAAAERAAGGDRLVVEAVVARADALRRTLAGENPNAVEVLLAERAALCWVVTHQYELLYLGKMGDRLAFKEHEFHERRIGAANKRFLAALRTLAAVRRLKLPDLLAVVKVVAPAADAREAAATVSE